MTLMQVIKALAVGAAVLVVAFLLAIGPIAFLISLLFGGNGM
jgi:hypothetical protein